ncbi:MAG: xanthine dehydrogenase family protein molybdopterin-binding subunit, partial [Acidimicrobiales bacterium]
MSILGNRVLRREDPRLLRGGGTYVDNLPLPRAVHVTYVQSTVAHARIAGIDTSEALASPGVLAVYTASDLDLAPIPPPVPMLNPVMSRPCLAGDVTRFVGELVAAVVSETRAQGADAAERVIVDYEPLPAVVDPEAAEQNEVLLFPEAGSNVVIDLVFGRTDELFEGCEVVVNQRIVNQRLAPCPLEVRAGAASWGPDGRLTVWASSQAPHGYKQALVGIFGLAEDQVRGIAP